MTQGTGVEQGYYADLAISAKPCLLSRAERMCRTWERHYDNRRTATDHIRDEIVTISGTAWNGDKAGGGVTQT